MCAIAPKHSKEHQVFRCSGWPLMAAGWGFQGLRLMYTVRDASR
jgi:hypothetical protein